VEVRHPLYAINKHVPFIVINWVMCGFETDQPYGFLLPKLGLLW